MRKTRYMTESETINDWLSEYSGQTYYKHREGILKFLSFLGKTIEEVMEDYKDAEDKARWARDMGHEVIKFYHHMINEGYSINSARTWTIPVRAFFSAKATQLKVKRGAIPRAQIASNEHKFLQQELSDMYYYSNTFDKALLSLGVSIGYSTKDFLSLERDYVEAIVDQAIKNEIKFPYFDTHRSKTNVICRSFIMPEAVKCLKKYLEITPANKNGKLFDLSPDSLNDHLRKMAKAAGIKATGQIKWNLLRKFLFTGLLKAMDLLSAKLVLGKRISSDLLTYFLTEQETLKRRYIKAYPYFQLARNGDRISEAEMQLKMYRKLFRKMIIDSGLLRDINEDLSDDDVLSLYLQK
ncbi:MAG: hypothetical protein D4S01_07175 [Dehalococcoidia bacterium]|nr:MAG: hypothetical protein D4S01_07175 [Dehalococcoidia bacterium]